MSFTQSQAEKDCLSGITEKETGIYVVCADGGMYRFFFDPRKGGECVRELFYWYYTGSKAPEQKTFHAVVEEGDEWLDL